MTEDDIRKAMGEGLEKMNPLVKNVTKELMDAYELGFLTCFKLLTEKMYDKQRET